MSNQISTIMVLFRALVFIFGTVVVSSTNYERKLQDEHMDPLSIDWAKNEQLANFINDKIESSMVVPPTNTPTNTPTHSPTIHPTNHPTKGPTSPPSTSPTQYPTEGPTVSLQPTGSPSSNPSEAPSIPPTFSTSPTIASSIEPSTEPTSWPSFSQVPTLAISVHPTISPSSDPSLHPSPPPSYQPSQSSLPSHSPTETAIISSSIVISQSDYRNSTPLLVVGACCIVVIASTSIYLYKRDSHSRRDKRRRIASPIIEVSTDNLQHGGGISPYSNEGGLTFGANDTDCETGALGQEIEDCNDFTKKRKTVDNIGGSESVPNSVSIIRRNDALPNEASGYSKLSVPKSYVRKMLWREKDGDDNSQQIITWNQIREEDRSSCSSGCAAASAPSPMMSPFFVKGLSSILSPAGKGNTNVPINEIVSNEMEEATEDNPQDKSSDKSPMKEIVVKRQTPIDHEYANNNISLCEGRAGKMSEEQKSPKTLGSKSSDGSSIEWGIDVSKVQPSKASFEANMAELHSIMVSIKSMGSSEAPSAEDSDVQLTYTEDTSETDQKAGCDDRASSVENIGVKSIVSQGDIDSIKSDGSNDEGSHLPRDNVPGITFGRELLKAGRMSEDGTFTFRNIFNDPKNELYECHAPSGPLGIVLDTTPLGPRVRSLNPLSPIFGKVSPGDVIVGVDEVDTVGMEAGDFWKIVSRKANQQERVLTMLRI